MKAVLKEHGKTDREVLLVRAANEIELNVYESLFKSYDIPILKKRREAGGYLKISMGMNIYGADIYVSDRYYEMAKSLLKNLDNSKNNEDIEMQNEERGYHKKRLARIWIIIAIFYAPFVIFLIYTLIRRLFF